MAFDTSIILAAKHSHASPEAPFTFHLIADDDQAASYSERFEALTKTEQLVLLFLALMLAPVTGGECVELCRRSRAVFPEGKNFNKVISSSLINIQAKGFLRVYDNLFWCNPEVQPWVLARASDLLKQLSDRFKNELDLVQLTIMVELTMDDEDQGVEFETFDQMDRSYFFARVFRLFHVGLQLGHWDYFEALFLRMKDGKQRPRETLVRDGIAYTDWDPVMGAGLRNYIYALRQSNSIDQIEQLPHKVQMQLFTHYFYNSEQFYLFQMQEVWPIAIRLSHSTELSVEERRRFVAPLITALQLSGRIGEEAHGAFVESSRSLLPEVFCQITSAVERCMHGDFSQMDDLEQRLRAVGAIDDTGDTIINTHYLLILQLFSLKRAADTGVMPPICGVGKNYGKDWQRHQSPYYVVSTKLSTLVTEYNNPAVASKKSELARWFESLFDLDAEMTYSLFCKLVYALYCHWMDMTLSAEYLVHFVRALPQLNQIEAVWLAGQVANVLQKQPEMVTLFDQWSEEQRELYTEDVCLALDRFEAAGLFSLLDILPVKPRWQSALQQIAAMTDKRSLHLPDDQLAEERAVWVMTLSRSEAEVSSDGCRFVTSISPKIQKRNKKGGWSKGRAFNLKDVKWSPHMLREHFSEEEQRIIQRSLEEDYGYGRRASTYLNVKQALPLLVEHPRLFIEGQMDDPVQLVEARPELVVTHTGHQYCLTMEPMPPREGVLDELVVRKRGLNRYELIAFKEEHLTVASILGESGLTVPMEAQAELVARIQSIAPFFTVHSDLDADDQSAIRVPADNRLYVQLVPRKEAVELQIRVYPLGEDGVALLPGLGSKFVTAGLQGQQMRTVRDLEKERANVQQLIDQAPFRWDLDEDYSMLVEGVEASYETILFLTEREAVTEEEVPEDIVQEDTVQEGAVQEESVQSAAVETEPSEYREKVVLQWPEGKPFDLMKLLPTSRISINVTSNQDWFDVDGKVIIDSNRVFTFQQMIELMDQSSSGRFVKLSDKKVVALSERMREQLEQWRARTDRGKVHPLAIPALEGLVGEEHIQANDQLREAIQRFDQPLNMDKPIPKTLNASLRDYQEVGYRWLDRLGCMGVGACLADDMGLGKTLQTLAVLLDRANRGPALVIAPKSVCHNWVIECERFAPALTPVDLNDCSAAERLSILTALAEQGPEHYLVISSYGIMQNTLEALQGITWGTIVADEAQAIKNPAAKRSRAACSLMAEFKLALTGTPIENHLGELWSIFRFINPGLLGSLERFNQRFAYPIEQRGDVTRKQHLQALIQPFILRRLKTEVLKELPPRTEISLEVILSDEERAFYEAIRQQAVERLSSGQQEENKLIILAQLSRLRQACCHPSLVMKGAGIEKSSKHELLCELVDELRENNHKALIFSQFVGHLTLIRARLDQKGIHYQYIDGSTTAKHRQQAVEAFQKGEGDLFLISLKAGGFGLNLTAADYVIHMDPWWNPAVEDQASDRAHRLGQTKPVTIYRLVTKGTIEEKIVKLHEQKRDLATALLSDSGSAKRLSADELMALIAEHQ